VLSDGLLGSLAPICGGAVVGGRNGCAVVGVVVTPLMHCSRYSTSTVAL
jgi:hypothetical protein